MSGVGSLLPPPPPPRLRLTLADDAGSLLVPPSDGPNLGGLPVPLQRRLSACTPPALPVLLPEGVSLSRRASFCPSTSSPVDQTSRRTSLCPPSPDGSCTPRRLSVSAPGAGGRRLSTSALLQAPSLSGYADAAAKAKEAQAVSYTRRKISQAGQALVATTLGWRPHSPPRNETVVSQSKSLCGRFIRARVRACCPPGPHQKKLGFQRLKSITNLTTSNGGNLNHVYSRICNLAVELEKGHPKLYGSVSANVGYKALATDTSVRDVIYSVSRELFRTEINWGRIVALFVVSGALAVDCVQLGKPEFVLGLVEEVGSCLETMHVASWIANQGGWDSLLSQFRKSWTRVLIKYVAHICLCLAVGLFIIWTY